MVTDAKFKIGDKVRLRKEEQTGKSWRKDVGNNIMTIKEIYATKEEIETKDLKCAPSYFVCENRYGFEEKWLEKVEETEKEINESADLTQMIGCFSIPESKFKIGDRVKVKTFNKPIREITDVVTLTFARDNHTEYTYYLEGEPFGFGEYNLEAISNEELLTHDLEICGNKCDDCEGCSYKNPDGTKTRDCYNQINLDAAELIKKLQKRVKELEEKK